MKNDPVVAVIGTVNHGETIVARINEEAAHLCAKLLEEARQASRSLLEEARAKAKASSAAIDQDSDTRVGEIKERIFSALNLEKRKISLAAKDDFARLVLGRLDSLAADLRKDRNAYRQFLIETIARGARILEAPSIIAMYSFLDEDVLKDEGFFTELSARAPGCRLELKKSDFTDIGLLLSTSDALTLYDNRFQARLKRALPEVYQGIIEKFV